MENGKTDKKSYLKFFRVKKGAREVLLNFLKKFFSKEKKPKNVSVVSVRNGNHIRPSDEVIKEHFNEMKKNISYHHIKPF